jgi:hypothetical protein
MWISITADKISAKVIELTRCTQGMTNFLWYPASKHPSLKPEQAITQKYSV